jgi:hypothetical protein
MTKRKKTNGQIMTDKILPRKLNIEQHEPNDNVVFLSWWFLTNVVGTAIPPGALEFTFSFLLGSCCSIFSLRGSILSVIICPFVFFLLVIVFSVLLLLKTFIKYVCDESMKTFLCTWSIGRCMNFWVMSSMTVWAYHFFLIRKPRLNGIRTILVVICTDCIRSSCKFSYHTIRTFTASSVKVLCTFAFVYKMAINLWKYTNTKNATR